MNGFRDVGLLLRSCITRLYNANATDTVREVSYFADPGRPIEEACFNMQIKMQIMRPLVVSYPLPAVLSSPILSLGASRAIVILRPKTRARPRDPPLFFSSPEGFYPTSLFFFISFLRCAVVRIVSLGRRVQSRQYNATRSISELFSCVIFL